MVSGTVVVDRRPRAGNVGRAARCAIRRSVCPAREAPSIPGRGGMMGLAEYRRTQAQLADYLPWAGLVAPGVVLDKDGAFQRTARFRGPDLDSAPGAELVAGAGRLHNERGRASGGDSVGKDM